MLNKVFAGSFGLRSFLARQLEHQRVHLSRRTSAGRAPGLTRGEARASPAGSHPNEARANPVS